MKRIAFFAAVLFILTAVPAAIFAQDQAAAPKTATAATVTDDTQKESADMIALRHKTENLRIEILQYMIKHGKIDKTKAEYRIAKIKNNSTFKDTNPEWVKFRRPMPCDRKGTMRDGRKGRRGDKMRDGRRGRRGSRMCDGRMMRRKGGRGMMLRRLYFGVKVETEELKALRHKAEEVRIGRLQFAAGKGWIDKAKAEFMVKKIQSNSKFKDANPQWVQNDRFKNRGRAGRRGGMGQRRGY